MYSENMQTAARRHLLAGEVLRSEGTRLDVAGYLFGIAAECAVKALMLASGMRPLAPEQHSEDPFYAHFEILRTMLRNTAHGRLATELRRYAEDSSFMQFWDVKMRYSDGRSIRSEWVERWHASAKDVVGVMDM